MDEPESSQVLQEQFPEYCHPNVWPREDLPELEEAFKELGQFIVGIGKEVAKKCDAFVHSKIPEIYSPTHLQDVIRTSKTTKARLLHYFPQTAAVEGESKDDMDTWCGWHLDHGSLTGLTSAMYIDESKDELQEVSCPDPEAGLYIRNRGQQVIKASIPRDHLAFQTGEALQLATRDQLAATPHCVRGATAPGDDPRRYATLARNTFAVFMQPSLETIVTEDGRNFGEWTKEVLDRYYDKEQKP
jgi:isopenicillin N synthase-like dioxygenase